MQDPNHYSSRPQTYHQKSYSHMSTPPTPTSGATRHGQFASGESEEMGHGRGPTSAIERGIEASATDRSWQTQEEIRLDEDARKERHWRRWGCYLAERQWVSRVSVSTAPQA